MKTSVLVLLTLSIALTGIAQDTGLHRNPDGSYSAPASALSDDARRAIVTLKSKGISISAESVAAEIARSKHNAETTSAPTDSREVVELEGGFAYILPVDWVLRDVPRVRYKMIFGRESDGNPANISFTVATFDGNLGKFVTASIEQLRSGLLAAGFTNFKVINMCAFDTTSKQIGSEVVIQGQRQDQKILRSFLYIFERKDEKKVVATCTTDDKNTYQEDFDAIMKSFRVTR